MLAVAVAIALGLASSTADASLLLAVAALPLAGMVWWALGTRAVGIAAAAGVLPALFGASPDAPIFSFGLDVYIGDLVLAAMAATAFVFHRQTRRTERVLPLQVLTFALLGLFIATVLLGVLRGQAVYGESLFNPITRFLAYLVLSLSVAYVPLVSMESVLRWTAAIGMSITLALGLFFLATGTSQTDQASLSTGGTRYLGLSVALCASFAIVLAVLFILHRPARSHRYLEAFVLSAGVVVQLLALGRSVILPLVVIIGVLILQTRASRSKLVVALVVLAPVGIAVAVIARPPVPAFLETSVERFAGTSSQDRAVAWREGANRAVLQGLEPRLITGFGFGRDVSFDDNGVRVYINGSDPHNGYLYLLSGGGLLAVLSFIALSLSALLVGRRRAQDYAGSGERDVVLTWAAASLILFLANLVSGPALSQPWQSASLALLLSVLLVGGSRNLRVAPLGNRSSVG